MSLRKNEFYAEVQQVPLFPILGGGVTEKTAIEPDGDVVRLPEGAPGTCRADKGNRRIS